MPRGDGRLLLSGAMDAWRFRAADNGAFDRFWQATIAGLALAVPPPIAITVDPPLLRPGEPGDVIVRVRSRDVTAVSASLDARADSSAARARGRCVPRPIRGEEHARPFDARGSRRGDRAVARRRGPLLVRRGRSRAGFEPPRPSLAMLASSHRGIDVTPDRIAELERFLRDAVSAPRTPRIASPDAIGLVDAAVHAVPFAPNGGSAAGAGFANDGQELGNWVIW